MKEKNNETADYVSLHIDSTPFVVRNLQGIKQRGMKCRRGIYPSQRMDIFEPYLDLVDMVTVMSVEPGFARPGFMESALPRLAKLNRMRSERNPDFFINIDGSLNYKNLHRGAVNGANGFVTGSHTVLTLPDGIVGACDWFEKVLQESVASIAKEGQ